MHYKEFTFFQQSKYLQMWLKGHFFPCGHQCLKPEKQQSVSQKWLVLKANRCVVSYRPPSTWNWTDLPSCQ